MLAGGNLRDVPEEGEKAIHHTSVNKPKDLDARPVILISREPFPVRLSGSDARMRFMVVSRRARDVGDGRHGTKRMPPSLSFPRSYNGAFSATAMRRLSKSGIIAFCKCPRRLRLELRRPRPEAYLRRVFERLPDTNNQDDLRALLPAARIRSRERRRRETAA